MQEKQVTINGKKMFYRQSGEGPAVVVLVHGFGEDGKVWQNQFEALKEFHLIIPDLPGSGDSEMIDDMSMEGLATALQQLIVHETATVFYKQGEPGSVIMIGHSMGGYITLAFVEKFPAMVKAYGLFHSSAFADNEAKIETRRKGIAFIEKNGGFEFLKTVTPNLYSPDTKERQPKIIEDQISLLSGFSGDALIKYYEAMINRPDRTTVLKTVNVPVLFILGKFDNAVPFEDGMKQCYLPSISHVHILEHSGHMGMQEESSLSNAYLKSYLEACVYTLHS